MDSPLTKGGNIPWPHQRSTLTVAGLPTGGSVLAFLVTNIGKVRTDDDFVFFNNPSVAGVTVIEHTATVDLDRVPVDIDRVVIAAVQDDNDPRRYRNGKSRLPLTPPGWRYPSPV